MPPAAGIPLGRYGTAEEVANVVQFLCSDLAGNVTGAQHAVDGTAPRRAGGGFEFAGALDQPSTRLRMNAAAITASTPDRKNSGRMVRATWVSWSSSSRSMRTNRRSAISEHDDAQHDQRDPVVAGKRSGQSLDLHPLRDIEVRVRQGGDKQVELFNHEPEGDYGDRRTHPGENMCVHWRNGRCNP